MRKGMEGDKEWADYQAGGGTEEQQEQEMRISRPSLFIKIHVLNVGS